MIDVFRFSSCRNMLVCACLQGVVGEKRSSMAGGDDRTGGLCLLIEGKNSTDHQIFLGGFSLLSLFVMIEKMRLSF